MFFFAHPSVTRKLKGKEPSVKLKGAPFLRDAIGHPPYRMKLGLILLSNLQLQTQILSAGLKALTSCWL